MKKVIEFFKNHYGKIFAGTTGTIIFTFGGFFFSDIRYAKNAEFKALQEQVEILKKQVNK